MKNKIVIWAKDEADKKFLLAIELIEKENKVNIYKFPENVLSEEFNKQLNSDWKDDKEVVFVDGYETITKQLSVTDDLLPDGLLVEKPEVITRAKAEWHFVVLSSKLYELYSSEVADIKDKVDKMQEYSSSAWEEIKTFWDKVQGQVNERNLFREHANELRDATNSVFDKLKEARKALDNKFKEESKEQAAFFHEQVANLKEKIKSGNSLQPIFDELKNLQKKFTKVKFANEDRNKIWGKIDEAFKELKEKKYGKSASGGGDNSQSATSRLESRLSGLENAISRMKDSIDRDLKDKRTQSNQAENAGGQLEAQLRQARIGMIDERINSKQIKMKDMLETKTDLLKKIESEKARDEKRKLNEEIKAKVEEKKQEIKEQIAEKTNDLDAEEAAKLAAAGAAIAASQAPKVKKSKITKDTSLDEKESLADKIEDAFEDISDKVEDVVEDVVDKVKSVAAVAIDKLEDLVEKLTGDDDDEDDKTKNKSEEE